ncbi:MAG: TolC family protein [Treponema sp.]|nr:TolC family protein [Treponema sp.]
MNFRKITTTVLTVLLLSAAVSAEQKVLTLNDAVKYASENNLSLQQSRITLDGLKRTKDYSWNSVSPSVTAGGTIAVPNDQTNSSYNYSESITGTLSLTLTPSLYTSMKTAYLNYENGKITYDEAVRSIELSVRKTFYGLLYEQENITLQQRNLETAEKQYNQNKVKYLSGQVSELDMLTSQVTYEKLKPTLESAQVTFNNDLASFKQVLGIEQTADIALSGSLDDVLALKDISVSDDLSGTPSVLSAENSVAIAETTLLAKRFSAYGPTVSAGWTYGKQKLVSDKTDIDPTTTGSFSLGVSIPLDGYLPWSADGLSVASAQDSVKTAKIQLESEKTTISVQITNYLNQIRQGQSQLDSLQANISLAQKSFDMTQTAYAHGSKDLLSLQSASDSLLSAKVSFASQEYTLISAVLSLESVLGVPFGSLGK